MDETVPTPEILPQSDNPPVAAPSEEKVSPPASPLKLPPMPELNLQKIAPVGVIVLIVLIILVAISAMRSNNQAAKTISVAPTPTPTPVPVVSHTLAPYATKSAFLNFETAIDALPGTIQNAVLQDQTLTPPELDLSLGFSN